MARWKLSNAHYLNLVDGAKWEQVEIDRSTAKQIRKSYPVPTFLDPQDPDCCNAVEYGPRHDMVVVSNGGTHEPRDYMFKGQPTPDMIPLDAEAKAISEKLSTKWNYQPHEGEGENDTYARSLVDRFQTELESLKAQVKPETAKIEGMDQLLTSIQEMMKQNQMMLSAIIANSQPKSPERKV